MTIMPDVTVGEGAAVDAHSFVNSDVPNDTSAARVPARSLTRT